MQNCHLKFKKKTKKNNQYMFYLTIGTISYLLDRTGSILTDSLSDVFDRTKCIKKDLEM